MGMVPRKSQAMRPKTPTLDTSQAGRGPTSPPETPTTGSPTFTRKPGPNGGRPSPKSNVMRRVPRPSAATPLGGVGSQFAFHHGPRPAEISPRSTSSSGDDEEEEDDEELEDDSDSSASPPQSPLSHLPEALHHVSRVTVTHQVILTAASFSIEEMSDEDDDDDIVNDFEPLNLPFEYEEFDSDRSRVRTRRTREMDPKIMRDFQTLNCFDSSDDSGSEFNDDVSEAMAAAIEKRRRERRHRRMTSGSISKRTVSDRGSDSDREDLQPYDYGDAGPNPRRIRRKTDRFSWMSSATTHDTIYELKEPNSDAEASIDENGNLARELPYYLYMGVDSE